MEMLKPFALISSTHATDEYAKVFLSQRSYYIPLLMKCSCPNICLSDDWSFTLDISRHSYLSVRNRVGDPYSLTMQSISLRLRKQ